MQIISITNEMTVELLQTCKGKCYGELHANKLENLGRMDKFLEDIIV